MGCLSCNDKSAAIREYRARARGEKVVTEKVMDARFDLCVACEQHEAGRCRLLAGIELADFIVLSASHCPYPPPRW